MQTKICTKCGEEKPLDEFYKRKTGKFGRKSQCKNCKRIHRNLEKARQYNKNSRANPEFLTKERLRRNKYRKLNREKINSYSRKYYHWNIERNRLQQIKRQRRYYVKHKDEDNFRKYHKNYRIEHREKLIVYLRQYRIENAEQIKEKKKQSYIKRIKNNPIEKMKRNIRRKKCYLERRQRIWQGQPQNQKELIIMFRMLLDKTLKASRNKNLKALNSLKAKYEQFVTMAS